MSIELLLGSAKGVEPVDMDIFGLREAEDTSNSLLLKGLGLGKGHGAHLGHIRWTVWMDDDNMVGYFQIGPYTHNKKYNNAIIHTRNPRKYVDHSV